MNDSLRRWIYGLLITTAVAMAAGRIVSAQLVYEPAQPRAWPAVKPRPMPTFGSNDRSRWATIRALVDEGTFVVGRRDPAKIRASAVAGLAAIDPLQTAILHEAGFRTRVGSDTGIIFEDGWQSVDKVLHPDTLEFYSSKPPLLSYLLAALYWLLQQLTGWTLADQPALVVRTLLLLVNAVPFGVYLVVLARIATVWGRTDEGRLYVVVAGAFATLVTPFLNTLNNHTLGTFCVLAAWAIVLCAWHVGRAPAGWRYYVAAGFFSAFAVCNELPALAFAVAVFALLLWRAPLKTVLGFLPPTLLVTAAFFAVNYAAVGQWRPAYSEFGSPWYEYEGSHWRRPRLDTPRPGIDWAKDHESGAEYAVHVLVGHHGLFALSPIWLLSVVAMLRGSVPRRRPSGPAVLPWFVQPLGLALTVVVIAFYIQHESRNYGGWTNGLRWLMWLTPLWLTCLLPVIDRLVVSRLGRVAAVALLAVSIFSVHYQPWNPWRHPWLYDFLVETKLWEGY